jgi:hypothetical protein
MRFAIHNLQLPSQGELLLFYALLLLIPFGFIMVVVAGFCLIRFIRSNLRSKPFSLLRKGESLQTPFGKLAGLIMGCGPFLGLFVALLSLPAYIREFHPDRTVIGAMLLIMAGLGAILGIIAGGALWVSSALLERVRRTAKPPRGGDV